MRMKTLFISAAAMLACLTLSGGHCFGAEKTRIVTTTALLADLAGELTGDAAEVHAVASPNRDLHFVEPTPKDVLKVRKADIFIYHGLQAEPWLLPLLNAGGRQAFLETGGQAVDASRGIEVLEVPENVSRLDGDIHAMGNPHYWTSPDNVLTMIRMLTDSLAQMLPERAEAIRFRGAEMLSQLTEKNAEWHQRLADYKGTRFVSYHRSWSYFADAFTFVSAGEIEPKPGIPVTSRHLEELTARMKRESVKLIIKEPYQESRSPSRLAEETGAVVVNLMQFPGAERGIDHYIEMMDANVARIETALKGES